MLKNAAVSFLLVICLFSGTALAASVDEKWDMLSVEEQQMLDGILEHWASWVPLRQQDGTAPLMTYEELFQGLEAPQVDFLQRVRHIDPRETSDFQGRYFGDPDPKTVFLRIDNQWIEKDGEKKKLDPQYLTEPVYQAYLKMMEAMQADLGKKLLIESGYRSPAYQLYTFLFYTPKHRYSLAETGQWVAIPGYSEHGAPGHQALDFINEQGINGEDRVEDFEVLPEYTWLMNHAERFGFELSYPRGQKGITFEPWHWRYINTSDAGKAA